MAKYKIIPSSRTIVHSPISIGHKAEKGVEAIEFDLTAWVETYGSGTLTVIMRRWGDAIPYPIALEIGEDNKATWTLSDIDTAKAGMAYAQLNYIVGDEVVKKSDIYTFRVMDSLTGEGEPPEAYESWLEHLTHLAAEAMAEVLDIEGIVTDKTLTVDGGIADAKAAGDALALKADQSTTYTKAQVDGLIEDVEVETDTTLSVSGAPADAKKTGDELSALKADLGALAEFESVVVSQASIDETLSGNTDEVVKLQYNYLQGKTYEITVTFNEVHWKSNGTQFVRIGAYTANNIGASYLVEYIRLDTDVVSGGTLTVRYVPSTETVKMIGLAFYLGAGTQDIEVEITESYSVLSRTVANLSMDAVEIMPVVESVSQSFSGTISASSVTQYIKYGFYKGNRYKLNLDCILGAHSRTNCLAIATTTARNTGSAYQQDIINGGSSANPICGTINEFSTGDSIEEEFEATKDASYLKITYYATGSYQIDGTIGRISSVRQLSEITGRGVVALNKDVEPYLLQFGREISANTAEHSFKRLNFLFFSDIHAREELWGRICDYMDEYSDIIPFAIHAGDYVSSDLSSSSVKDLYGLRKPKNGAILNTVGNHDCNPAGQSLPTAPIADTYNALYASVDTDEDGWNCTFGSENYAMYWYKDDAEAKVRIICIDQYHWTTEQSTFITNALTSAITLGYGVVTITHTPITTNVDDIGSGFWTLDDWVLGDTYSGSMIDIRSAINAFVQGGGIHIVHLCGHIHSDEIGTLHDDDIFQIRTQTASDNGLWTDTVRAVGTKTYDCFNVIQIDRNLRMVKLVRVGNNTSDCLQARTTLCFDYVNKRLISNK